MSVKAKTMDNVEPVKGVGPVDFNNEKFRDAHKNDFRIALQQIVSRGHSDQVMNIEAYGVFFYKPLSGDRIELRAKLQNANSALLVTIYSDKMNDEFMFKLIKDNVKHTKPSKKSTPKASRSNKL